MRKPLALVAVVVLLLSSCSSGGGDEDEPAADPSGSTSSEASEAPPEEVRDLYRGTVFETLPDGQAQTLAVVKEERKFPAVTDFLHFGGVVFGDDVAVLAPETQLLTGVSTETGELLWQTRLPKYKGEVEPLCPLGQLPPEATVGVVLMGLDCAVFVRYDVATGKLLGTDPQLDAYKFPHLNAWFALDRHTYWIDQDDTIRRFGPDGESEFVIDRTALDLELSENVFRAMPIVGSDVVALSVSDYDGPIGASYDKRWIGLRVPAEGTPEVVWSTKEKAAVTRAEPGGKVLPDGTAVFDEPYGGTIESTILQGIRHPRLNRLNPETGALDTGLVLQRDPAGGFPAWADSLGADALLPLTDGMVSASGDGGFAGFAHLSFYDYTTGKVRWAFTKEYKHLSPQVADPIGTSTDGAHVYAMVWADRARLVELDAATGELERTWLFPDDIGFTLSGAEVYVQGDLLVWLSQFANTTTKTYAATFRLG